ncbi:unnamed protein product [Prunus armeniaca]
MSQGDHVWSTDMLEVSGRRVGEVGDGPLIPLTYCDDDAIRKKLVLDPDMMKVRQALSIPAKFREWRWLLSEHRKKVGGLPPAEDIERWKLHCLKLSDLQVEQDESSTESPEDRKACSGPARDGAAVSRSMDTSLQRGQPRSSFAANKSSSQEASSAGIKRLVSANSRKANGMQEVRDMLFKSPTVLPKTCDLLCKEAVEKQGSGRLRRSGDQTERTVPLPSHHDSSAGPRTIKRGADSMLQAASKKAKESSARAKSPPVARTAGLGISDNSVGGEPVSDLLKTGFLSSPSTCAKLADHVYRAADLCAFSSLPLDKQEEAALYHLQKGMVFAVGAMQNSHDVAPFSALLDELVKKNADLTDKLSNERIRHDARISEMKESMSALKSSVGQKDDEVKSLMATLLERKEAYFSLERKHAALAQDRDRLLVKFDNHVEATEASKHEIAANAYKLGYLDCQNGAPPCCPLEDDDDEQSSLDLPPAHSKQINVVDAEAVEEQVADEAATEEDKPQGGSAEEGKEQAAKAVE